MCFVGVDYFYGGIVVGKFEGDFVMICGWYDYMCEEYCLMNLENGVFFD